MKRELYLVLLWDYIDAYSWQISIMSGYCTGEYAEFGLTIKTCRWKPLA